MPKKAAPTATAPTPKKRGPKSPLEDPRLEELVLRYIREGNTVAMAAKKATVSATQVFWRVRTNEQFAERYAAAMEYNTDHLEEMLQQHAFNGNITALFGTLKARRPEKWRDNYRIDHTNSDGSFQAFASGMLHKAQELDSVERQTEH
jgi:transposase-like protein